MKRFISLISLSALLLTPVLALAEEPYEDYQWYLDDLDVRKAWQETKGEEIIVAVLDSGTKIDHEDLDLNIWQNPNEIEDGIDNDENGFIDDIYGPDFIDGEGYPEPELSGTTPDALHHGTLVASVIGALQNDLGIVGVAPEVTIMPIRVLAHRGSGAEEDVADAIFYAIENGADIINLSFTGDLESAAIDNALQFAYQNNVTLIAAAGNDGINLNEFSRYPVCAGTSDADWVLGVGASSESGSRSDFSNYGNNCVDIYAPGERFIGALYYEEGDNEKYGGYWEGTSVAAPVVSGTVALMKSIMNLTNDQVKIILQQTGTGSLTNVLNTGDAVDFTLNLKNQFAAETKFEAFIKADEFSTVYGVKNGERFVVPNELFFSSYNEDVYTVTLEDLGDYKLAGTVLPQIGSTLIKIQSDPKVYYWGADEYLNATLQPIPDEETAELLFGKNWNRKVIDVDVSLFARFEIGTELTKNAILPIDKLRELRYE